jgi:hypothetical protein
MHSQKNDFLKPALSKHFEKIILFGIILAPIIYFTAWFGADSDYLIKTGMYNLSSSFLITLGIPVVSPAPCSAYVQHIFSFSLCTLLWLGFSIYVIVRMIPNWQTLAKGEMEYARVDRGSSPAKIVIIGLGFIIFAQLTTWLPLRYINKHFCEKDVLLFKLASSHIWAFPLAFLMMLPMFLYAIQLTFRRKTKITEGKNYA